MKTPRAIRNLPYGYTNDPRDSTGPQRNDCISHAERRNLGLYIYIIYTSRRDDGSTFSLSFAHAATNGRRASGRRISNSRRGAFESSTFLITSETFVGIIRFEFRVLIYNGREIYSPWLMRRSFYWTLYCLCECLKLFSRRAGRRVAEWVGQSAAAVLKKFNGTFISAY